MAVATERTTQRLMVVEHDEAQDQVDSVAASAQVDRPKWLIPVAFSLVLMLIAALIAATWFGIKAVHGFGAERGRANAVEAAKMVAIDLTTFDVGTAEADTKHLLAGTTPTYAAGFAGDEDTFIRKLHENQSRSTGTVTGAGVVSYNEATDTAHVLVSVRAQVANTAIPAGQARDYRLDITMVDQGAWLADGIEFVS